MTRNKLFSYLSLMTMLLANSGYVYAEEYEEVSTFSYWPLILLLIVVVVFRNKLIAEATPEETAHHDDDHDHDHVEEPVKKEPVKAASPVPAAKKSRKGGVVDLTEDQSRCQGGTVKGTQCSRRTGLEAVDVELEGKKYRLMTCKQHNTQPFKPFNGLI